MNANGCSTVMILYESKQHVRREYFIGEKKYTQKRNTMGSVTLGASLFPPLWCVILSVGTPANHDTSQDFFFFSKVSLTFRT